MAIEKKERREKTKGLAGENKGMAGEPRNGERKNRGVAALYISIPDSVFVRGNQAIDTESPMRRNWQIMGRTCQDL